MTFKNHTPKILYVLATVEIVWCPNEATIYLKKPHKIEENGVEACKNDYSICKHQRWAINIKKSQPQGTDLWENLDRFLNSFSSYIQISCFKIVCRCLQIEAFSIRSKGCLFSPENIFLSRLSVKMPQAKIFCNHPSRFWVLNNFDEDKKKIFIDFELFRLINIIKRQQSFSTILSDWYYHSVMIFAKLPSFSAFWAEGTFSLWISEHVSLKEFTDLSQKYDRKNWNSEFYLEEIWQFWRFKWC